MASYTYTQLYGSGSIGENFTINVQKTFTFTNPSGSSYFTMETIPSSSGFYEASSPKNFSGSFVVSESMGLITSSYIASIVVQPGTQVFKFTPAITVTGTTYYLRGTGAYSLEISSGGVSAPVNTILPEITGGDTIGSLLTTDDGTWTGSPTSYAYQWKRGATNIGTNANTYTLVTADAGTNITCVVTATNAIGSTNATSGIFVASALYAPYNTTLPFMYSQEGLPFYTGYTAVCEPGYYQANEPATLTYQWYSNDILQIGQTGLTYLTTILDQGFLIKVKETATNSQGSVFEFSNEIFVNEPE